jgi:hypothetical protein
MTLTLGGWCFLIGAWLGIGAVTVWSMAKVLFTKTSWNSRPEQPPESD